MKFRGLFNIINKTLSLVLVMSFFIDVAGVMFINMLFFAPKIAEAATVTIQSNPNTTAAVHNTNGSSLVFVNDQVGYKFYRYGLAPYNGACAYSKTTDGGNTWGSYVPFDTQSDCTAISVWYDRWTPGDKGDYIHIATIDTGNDDIFYNRLDTTNDTLLATTSVTSNLGGLETYAAGTNYPSITKGTNGIIYMVTDDAGATNIGSCSSGCNITANWSSVGTPPQGNADSWSQLLPLLSGNIMLINRSTTNQIRYSIWNGSSWSAIQIVAASAVRNTTYDIGMSATVDITNGDIYLVYTADNDTFTVADHDIRTVIYSGGSWSNKTDILTNDAKGVLQVGISRDLNNGDIYVGYTARATIGTANTANVYWKKSTDGMATWGAAQGPLNAAAGDFYGIDMNKMSDERVYVTWFDNVGLRDIYGNTMADIGPELKMTSVGSQKIQARAGVNNFYTGGSFSLRSLSNQTVSTIVLSENGTVQAQNNIKNVKVFYEYDTSSPYNCGSET
jgi:hypothetical protein